MSTVGRLESIEKIYEEAGRKKKKKTYSLLMISLSKGNLVNSLVSLLPIFSIIFNTELILSWYVIWCPNFIP